MRKLLVDAAHTLVPPKGDRHGPLPPLLLTLTVVTGLVDAVSYLGLGHVFVANMTGNVAFLGFALAGAEGFSAPASLTAMAAFLVGAVTGGRFGTRFTGHRGRLLAAGATLQAVLVAAALVTAVVARDKVSDPVQYVLIVTLGVAMGLQTAVARRLGVPDLTTTVLTQTLTGLAADSAATGRTTPPRPGRRLLSVLAMFLGALVGAVLLQVGRLTLVLVVTLALVLATALAVRRLSVTDASWIRP
ncbi:YoaK family protein [Streptomyces sp. NPDC012508]|uniref:YoaK family protein n=1 Tax=Streptomyces sp. NPDC012508 TaxID=3364837 RepID=UPI0036AE1D29